MPYDRIIDIYWKNNIDLRFANANNVRAVICKATEGTQLPANQNDAAKYPALKAQAQELDLLWGAYHLTNGADPSEQLAHFLTVEDGGDPSVLISIDWEDANDGTCLDLEGVRELVRLFAQRFNGRYPMLYGGSKIRDNADALRSDSLLGKCPLWYQQYSAHSGPLPTGATPLHFPIGPWNQYALWQYSNEDGNLYGAPVYPQLDGADWSRFNGDIASLQAAWPFSRVEIAGVAPAGVAVAPSATGGRPSIAMSPPVAPSKPTEADKAATVVTDWNAVWQGKRGAEAYVKCIGIRGGYDADRRNRLGIYDDLFVLLIGNQVTQWRGSTDPGQYYISHPINPRGCAQLCEGIHMFKIGLHQGEHLAFVQAEDFHVNRLDGQGNVRYVDFGEFGINLHSGGPGVNVDRFSAGCQVVQSPEGYFGATWHHFFDPAKDAMRTEQQPLFPYMLIDATSLS
jgi:Glycosyl hydrolases family 25